MRTPFIWLGLVVVMVGGPLFAQRQSDPDKAAGGGGTLPTGWSARLDNGSTKPDGVRLTVMGGGLHFQSGPAGLYFKPVDKASGTFSVQASFTQIEPSAHPEAFGLFIGGSDLQSDKQKYTYFLIRQDGRFLIKKRDGAATPDVVAWTENKAIKAGKAANTLGIVAAGDRVRFLINNVEVAAQPASAVDTNGIVGLRINHNLNVMVDGFSVKAH